MGVICLLLFPNGGGATGRSYSTAQLYHHGKKCAENIYTLPVNSTLGTQNLSGRRRVRNTDSASR